MIDSVMRHELGHRFFLDLPCLMIIWCSIAPSKHNVLSAHSLKPSTELSYRTAYSEHGCIRAHWKSIKQNGTGSLQDSNER